MPNKKILAKIDLNKVVKSEIYEGKKGRYLKFMLIEKPGRDSDGYIIQLRNEFEKDTHPIFIGSFLYKDEKTMPARNVNSSPEKEPF